MADSSLEYGERPGSESNLWIFSPTEWRLNYLPSIAGN